MLGKSLCIAEKKEQLSSGAGTDWYISAGVCFLLSRVEQRSNNLGQSKKQLTSLLGNSFSSVEQRSNQYLCWKVVLGEQSRAEL